jgi:hypothetical protein
MPGQQPATQSWYPGYPARYDEPAGAARSQGLRRLSKLTWRATQLSAVTAVGLAALFAHTAHSYAPHPAATVRPAAKPAMTPSPSPSATHKRHHHHHHHSAAAAAAPPAGGAAAGGAAASGTAPAPSPTLAPPTTAPAPPPTPAPTQTSSSGSHGGG